MRSNFGCCLAMALWMASVYWGGGNCQYGGLHRRRQVMNMESRPERLALWIDKYQIERLSGYLTDVYIIRGGNVLSYLLKPNQFEMSLPILPYEFESINLSWVAELEPYKYKFNEIKSLDHRLLYEPTLNISNQGIIPKKSSGFTLNMHCRGNGTGISAMNFSLSIMDFKGEHIQGSPLGVRLRKYCIAKPNCIMSCKHNGTCVGLNVCSCPKYYTGQWCERKICLCKNGGTCDHNGRCICPLRFYGHKCQLVVGNCEVPCKNGGYCSQLNVCVCPHGYTGLFCQKPNCKMDCGTNGKCVDVNVCECRRGWRGKQCNKTAKLNDTKDRNENTNEKKRRKRKLRNVEQKRMKEEKKMRKARRIEMRESLRIKKNKHREKT